MQSSVSEPNGEVEHDLIAVVRWIDKASVDGFVKLVVEGLTG